MFFGVQTKHLGRLPVVNFAAGGVATPADAALMMQMGMDGVFVGSGIFKAGDPAKRARAIVQVPLLCTSAPFDHSALKRTSNFLLAASWRRIGCGHSPDALFCKRISV